MAPVEEKLTEPVGVSGVPTPAESETVAVQAEAVFTVTGVVQVIVVEVERRPTVILKAVVVLLGLWAVSATFGA